MSSCLGLCWIRAGTNFSVCFVIDLSDSCSLHMYNYYFFFKNSGTQLLKKVATTPVKTSQTTNAVASTVQSPTVIQVGGKLYSAVE